MITAEPQTQTWDHCYDSSWKGFITDASFAHPAKFSRGLIERIYDHMLAQGYIKRGDLVADCFGGIGTGGLTAAYRGLRWVGVELEPRFVGMVRDNFKLHRRKLECLGMPLPQIVQGDSRRFHELIAGSSAVVSSPPYAESISSKASGIDWSNGLDSKGKRTRDLTKEPAHKTFREPMGLTYGQTPGQIGALSAGAVDSVVSSPPFMDSMLSTDKKFITRVENDQRNGSRFQSGGIGEYGNSEGQISQLKGGSVDAVATSPPYAPNEKHDHRMSADGKTRRRDQAHTQGRGCFRGSETYGETEGQIGRESPETYRSAMSQVYRSCFLALKPGGVMAIVLKDYVKGGKRVPLCDDSARLLEHIGFEPLERIRAMLTKKTVHSDLFNGETVTTKSRKSFFRRLAEKNGSPNIDFEEVLIYRRP